MRNLKRLLAIAVVGALAGAALTAAPAAADFGLRAFDVSFEDQDGSPATQAGSHPFAVNIRTAVNYHEEGGKFQVDDGDLKDLIVETARGLTGDITAVPRCSTLDFSTLSAVEAQASCADETAVGIVALILISPFNASTATPIFNLAPPPGVPVRLGFVAGGVPTVIDVSVKPSPDYNAVAVIHNSAQPLTVFGGTAQLWGVPADPAHDFERGNDCASAELIEGKLITEQSGEACPTEAEEKPFLVLPRACQGPLANTYRTSSWSEPDVFVVGGRLVHDFAEPPNPIGFEGCGKLPYIPSITTAASTDSADTGTGLDFELNFEDPIDHSGQGLTEPNGIAQSDTKDVAVTLPEGMTINPSIGEGLGVCTPADLERETLSAEAGEGCPNSSKIGTLTVHTPIVDRVLEGSVFLAQQDDPNTTAPGAENPFDTLIAFYMVIKNRELGALVKIPAKVEPDPVSGQLVTTVKNAPQVPFYRFIFHFREGLRPPLVTPPACGTHETKVELTPWARPNEVITRSASFQVTRGVGGGPCPPGGAPPFEPGFEAGAQNNNAGSYSPFDMQLLRRDGDQDLTKFSAVLPPGELGSLAGVSKCPDAAVPIAKSKTGSEEAAVPSCPANSLIGHTLAGAGVGGALTYVPGYVYLGGPYKGAPLSVISITPALAGPFDAGTVVVRLGLDLNSKTAEVEVDGAASDPIPHILKGIVLKVRDLRVHVDRPNFTLNPTSCDESAARATIFGSFVDVLNPADDVPLDRSTRYQAANCLTLGYKPSLNLNLVGGSGRGGNPGLRAHYKPRRGDANAEGLVVRLPRSAFLDQAHIRTICTRVQFAADRCPKAAQYGYIRAWTPLLDEPLKGPVWLRSSNHKLPDLVFDLHGVVDIEVAVRIDSARGGIRATLNDIPDAPLSRVLLRMQGGKKSLIVNSRDLCKSKSRANVRFSGHNGKRRVFNPIMRPLACGAKRKAKRARHSRAARVAGASALR